MVTIEQFIKENEKEINTYIRNVCPNCGKLSYSEIKGWILNNEELYNLALFYGVKFN